MELETHTNKHNTTTKTMKMLLLLLNCAILAVGNCGGPLLTRLYFLHGGARIWLTSWLQTAAWPFILLPLSFAYLQRRRSLNGSKPAKLFLMNRRVLVGSTVVGIIFGLADYLYAYGVARLPVSTSSLIIASQLVFTAVSAYFLVKQRFTAYSVNAVVLLTVGAVVLGVDSWGERPAGETKKQHDLGFGLTVVAAALSGFVLPLVELMYQKAKQQISFTLVMEVQLVMCFVATAFATVGMIINRDFQVIAREAREYELRQAKYYIVLVGTSVVWQLFFFGAIGIIFCASSLLSGVIIAVLLPFTEVLAVIFFREKFETDKGISLCL